MGTYQNNWIKKSVLPISRTAGELSELLLENIKKSKIELIVEDYEKKGRVKSYSIEESIKISEAIDDRMRKVRAEVRRLEFESRVAAEKIVLTVWGK